MRAARSKPSASPFTTRTFRARDSTLRIGAAMSAGVAGVGPADLLHHGLQHGIQRHAQFGGSFIQGSLGVLDVPSQVTIHDRAKLIPQGRLERSCSATLR